MYKSLFIACFLLTLLFCYAQSQDCISYGKRCSDHGQCCGGCCFEGFCIDTYRPCTELRNPCLEHYCPAGLSCNVFKPENCPECDLQAICE